MERRVRKHATRLVTKAAADTAFRPGQRVRTIDNVTGRVLEVTQSFSPGIEQYQVVLDNGMGGGTYTASQLRPVPEDLGGGHQAPSNIPAGITAALATEAELEYLASNDYPEMGTVLHDRPDPAGQITVIGMQREAADALEGRKEHWEPGERAHFEYHCDEGEDSHDRYIFLRSHEPVTVSEHYENDAWPGSTIHERAEEGVPHTYHVRHDDGFGHTAFEDELLTHPRWFHRPDPPRQHTAAAYGTDQDPREPGESGGIYWQAPAQQQWIGENLDEPEEPPPLPEPGPEPPPPGDGEEPQDGPEDDEDEPEGEEPEEDQDKDLPPHEAAWRWAALIREAMATDWGQHYDAIPGEIHRGLYAPGSHQVFSVPQSDEDIAHGLIAAHQEENFPNDPDQHRLFGTHWSSDEGVARDFAREHESEHFADHRNDHDEHFDAVPVVFHAQRPQRHEIEDDPRRLGWQNVDDYDTHEKEVPIAHGAPVHITGVSWLKHTGLGSMWHRHDLREPVKLRAEDRDSPIDPTRWNASLRTATQMSGRPGTSMQQVDDHGDAPDHGSNPDNPRAAEPNAYDGKSTEGHGDDKWDNAKAYDILPSPGSSVPTAADKDGHRTEEEVKKNTNGAQIGMFPENVSGGGGPGLEIGGFVAARFQYSTYGQDGGYVDHDEELEGPFYHGSRSRRLSPGGMLTPGKKINSWGDEGEKSQWVHITNDPETARTYADAAGGHVYEVEPTGVIRPGYHGSEFRTKDPVRIIRHHANVPWTGHERGELHDWSNGAGGNPGDFVPSSRYHTERYVPEPELVPDSEEVDLLQALGSVDYDYRRHLVDKHHWEAGELQDAMDQGLDPDDEHTQSHQGMGGWPVPMKHTHLEHMREYEPHPETLRSSLSSAVGEQGLKAEALVQRHRADQVYSQLAGDYPAKALDWVHSVRWHGPEQTALSDIDWADRKKWAAYHQPERVAKVGKKAQKRRDKGKDPKYAILSQVAGASGTQAKKRIGDGHHRGLDALLAGRPLDSMTAEVPDEKGPWAEMHAQQFENDGTGREDGPDGTPEQRDAFHGEVEGAVSRLPADEEPDGSLEQGEQGPQADTEDEANSLDFGDSAIPAQPPAMTGLPPWTQGTNSPAGQQPPKPGRSFAPPGEDGKPDFSSGKPKESGDKGGAPKEKPSKKEARLVREASAIASRDPSFSFEFTAAWRDVVAKAKRIRSAMGVRITLISEGMVIGEVRGDHDVYESGIQRVAGKPRSIMYWACGCPWASFHQDKTIGTRYAGRPCSHVYALQLESVSRTMHGRELYQDPSLAEIGMPPRQVVVKSLPPWGPGGWNKVLLAPAASLRTASREDDLYRHMRKSHGFSRGHMDALRDAGEGLEDWHHVDHHEYSRHSPDDLHSHVVHPQYEAAPGEAEMPGWKIPGAVPDHVHQQAADPDRGGSYHPDAEHRLTLSLPAQAGDPNAGWPRSFFSALQPPDEPDDEGEDGTDGPEYEAGPVRYHLGAVSDPDWREPGDLHGHMERKHGYTPELRSRWHDPHEDARRIHDRIHEVGGADHDHHALGDEFDPHQTQRDFGWAPDYHGGESRPGQGSSFLPWLPMMHSQHESVLRHLADQANGPWGSQTEPSHPPAKPFGATEPRAPETNPADYGFLTHPDPDNWQEIDETNASQMPLSNMASLMSWEDVGNRHPHIYGNPEDHGDEAEGADGEGIGGAANHLANDRPEDPDAENSDHWNMEFHHEKVHPRHIDYARHERGDPRVQRAYEGYVHGDKVPPLVLVHRHGIYQVADGHHRAQGAARAGKKVSAYVHYSEHEDTPFSDGTRGPFHGAEPHPGVRHEAALAGPDIGDWGPEYQESFPYSDQANTAGPSASITPHDPQGIRMEEAFRRALAELQEEPQPALAPEGLTADDYPLEGQATGGGPGMSPQDESLSPDDTSIQTMGQQQWSGGGADSDEVSAEPGMSQGDEYGGGGGTGQKEDDIIAAFQASAAARGLLGKTAEVFSDSEASQLIAEGRGTRARNLDLLDIGGTHYEDNEEEMQHRGLSLDHYDDDLALM